MLRPFLKNWVWEHGHVGTWYLDCRDGEVRFDDGKKSRFAAGRQVYVPLADNASAPAVHDGGLARFLRAALLARPADAGNAAEVERAVQQCLDLALVAAYQAEAAEARARLALEPLFEAEIEAAVAEEIRRVYAPRREQLARYDFTVFHGLPAALMIGEAPLIDWRVRARPAQPFVSIPLAPYALLVGTPSDRTRKPAPLAWREVAGMGPLKDHNRLMVEGARQWLVAIGEDPLLKLKDRFAPPAPADAPAPG